MALKLAINIMQEHDPSDEICSQLLAKKTKVRMY